ncbi:conserved Plasmodium protein, unknown function [Plasmodium gallinaceum]|uniref:RRM domain-containing protein n=1 Tax=Plasmodium gallinaceum TaxID=5849 RepID=A0A1J1GYD3_PLAGA|nr:conserved Plasmodium protein, unknown function [Plasmodium gallinaceum]CRG97496.1 conserved Plasmodium protein, unknown function [Plasmodium gallinaceum]
MICSQTCAANNTYIPSKMETFITKAPHEVTLTDSNSRLFIKNIKNGVTLEQFRHSLEKYGTVEVYLYEPGTNNNGWAWVGFENEEAALKVVEESEKPNDEEINEKEGSVHSRDDEKQDSNSFYEENEENQQNEEEEEEENDD